MKHDIFPFSAIVGQDRLKLALILNAINPRIGGVLIRGEKGTAKSTTVRALAELLPVIRVNKDCAWSCDPDDRQRLCDECKNKPADTAGQDIIERRARVVTLPLNATEDRVAGGIDFNLAVKSGARALLPGLLARSHRGILYVDEVNLLDDHIVDIILDAAASGKNRIEREGISFCHHSDFILVGTMNPEEGELRPQLLDRFGLCVEVVSEKDLEKRILLMLRKENYDSDPKGFLKQYQADNAILSDRIMKAKKCLKDIQFPDDLRSFAASLCSKNNVAGHRADLVIEQAARALAAFHGSGIKKHVHHMVIQKVDFIHIENPSVGGSQDTRLYLFFPFFQGLFHIHGADYPVLCGPDGQFNDFNALFYGFRHLAVAKDAIPAIRTCAFQADLMFFLQVMLEWAVPDFFNFRKDPGQSPDSRGFGRPFLSPDQNP